MKRILCILTVFVLLLAFVSCGKTAELSSSEQPSEHDSLSDPGSNEQSKPEEASDSMEESSMPHTDTSVFDPESIVLTFAALSDIHQNGDTTSDAGKKFASALAELKESYALDLFLIAGDMTDSGSEREISQFKTTFKSVYDGDIPVVYSLGNHDGQDGSTAKRFFDIFSQGFFSKDISADTVTLGNRHAVVNGFHFITVEVQSYYNADGNCTYRASTLEWLKTQLELVVAENPDAPVFVATHAMIYGTAYGSTLPSTGTNWYTTALTDILNEYPQAVTFGGHIHHPLNDERSIMQDKFTSVGCGSVSYMAIESGYIQTGTSTVPTDARQYSQGLVVEVDSNNNIRFTRKDFYNKADIKDPWIVSGYGSETFLKEYASSRAESPAPVFGTDTDISMSTTVYQNYTCDINITFKSASDDDMVHHYDISVASGGKEIAAYKLLSGFYLKPQVSLIPATQTAKLSLVPTGTDILITVTAVDSWENRSEPISCSMTTPGDKKPQSSNPDALSLYADIVFGANGSVSDALRKLELEQNGASVSNAAFSYNGASFEAAALNITKAGEGLKCIMKELKTAGEVTAFFDGGFTVEALYQNRSPSGTQGVICGTQSGGWGLAESSGQPYFIMSNGSYQSVYSGVAASDTELTHVVGVYDSVGARMLIYVNGKLRGETPFAGTLNPGAGSTFNVFYLGADVSANLSGGDFQMTDFSIIGARIYQGAATEADIAEMCSNINK